MLAFKRAHTFRLHFLARLFFTALGAVLAGAFSITPAFGEGGKPPIPQVNVPAITEVDAQFMCVGCDGRFGTATHKILIRNLAVNTYIGELRRALYFQDSVHQFESKAHFDNCDFKASTDYIEELLKDVGINAELAKAAKAANDPTKAKASAEKAFFSLGQALHGVQDFYAHSNYVELQVRTAKRREDVVLLAPWRPGGRERIEQLQAKGLVSGFVFWGSPQKCAKGALSHAALAKDSDKTPSGKKAAGTLGISQYQLAVNLARAASLEFMQDAFERWPILKEMNGPQVAFEIPSGGRGL